MKPRTAEWIVSAIIIGFVLVVGVVIGAWVF